MKEFISILIAACLLYLFAGCVTSGKAIKLTDEDGNSLIINDEGMALDLKEIEKDGIRVEVIEE